MFSTAKQQINKMMSMLPNQNDLMSLEEYNKYYIQMLKNQTDKDGNELEQKKIVEEQHRNIISHVLSSKLNSMKTIQEVFLTK